MAQKKEGGLDKISGIIEGLKAAIAFVPQVFLPSIFGRIHEEVDTILDNVEERMVRIQEKLVSTLIARLSVAALIGLGVLFLFIAGFFALREYFGLTYTLSFAIIGATMLVLGFFVRYQSMQSEAKR